MRNYSSIIVKIGINTKTLEILIVYMSKNSVLININAK